MRPLTIEPTGYYRESDVADLFGCGVGKVRRDRQTGGGPRFVKYGRQTFYLGSDLIAHLEATKRASTSAPPVLARDRARFGSAAP